MKRLPVEPQQQTRVQEHHEAVERGRQHQQGEGAIEASKQHDDSERDEPPEHEQVQDRQRQPSPREEGHLEQVGGHARDGVEEGDLRREEHCDPRHQEDRATRSTEARGDRVRLGAQEFEVGTGVAVSSQQRRRQKTEKRQRQERQNVEGEEV